VKFYISTNTLYRFKNIIAVVTLSVLLSACGGGSSSDSFGNATDGLTGGDTNGGTTANINTLINVANSDAWGCVLDNDVEDLAAYSFFADSTGEFDVVVFEGDQPTVIGTDSFSYTFLSGNSVQLLFEFDDGTSILETITNISFMGTDTFTAASDFEGSLDCERVAVF